MKDEIKKIIFTVLMIFLVGISSIVGALADGDYIGGDYEIQENLASNLINEDIVQTPLYYKLFDRQALSFVDVEVDDIQKLCKVDVSYGKFDKPEGKEVKSGSKCEVGQYIAYLSMGGDLPEKKWLFDELWYKSTSSDLPNFANYWVNDYSFDYVYGCYDCEVVENVDIEKGCLSKDRESCVNSKDSDCDIDYDYEKVCEEHIGETSDNVEITISNLEIESPVTKGYSYKITGKAKIEGICDNCVIESQRVSGLQAFALVGEEGVCGNDDTVGIKFDADNKWIEFELYDEAIKTGKYQIEVSAWNGCYKSLGDDLRKLDSDIVTIEVIDSVESEEIVGNDNTEDEDESNDVVCYFCYGNEMLSSKYDSKCVSGTSLEKMSCEKNIIEPSCDNAEDSESCSVDDSGSPISNTSPGQEESFLEEAFDFENNPKVAWGLSIMIGLIALIIGLIIYSLVKD